MMKTKIILFVLLQMMPIFVIGQNLSTEYFKVGKIWKGTNRMYFVDKPFYDFITEVTGDTVVDNVTYKLITRTTYEPGTLKKKYTQISAGYEKNGKIFDVDIWSTSRRHYEIFDLNVHVGQKYKATIVAKIDTIEVKGVRRRRFTLKNTSTGYITWFVEGIGYNNVGFIEELICSTYDEFHSIYEDGECIFTADDFNKEACGIDNIVYSRPTTNHKMYDLMGKEIKVPQKGQIYIRNRKKIATKNINQ